MAEEIAFENGRISNFQGLVTLTLDRVILHTVVHHSLTSTYKQNLIEIEETFCGRMDGSMDRRTCETHFIRSTQRRRPNKCGEPKCNFGHVLHMQCNTTQHVGKYTQFQRIFSGDHGQTSCTSNTK